jgi:alpha-tubulin suppressor-like RCC1 family protein
MNTVARRLTTVLFVAGLAGVPMLGAPTTAAAAGPQRAVASVHLTAAVPALGKTKAIKAGANFSCALTTRGGVLCWGHNAFGQLGNGTTVSSDTPVAVIGLTRKVTSISLGGYHGCALTTKGAVKCWGEGTGGQLGNGTMTNSATPVQVSGLTKKVRVIAAGGSESCAITRKRAVTCWGENTYGQLGNGTTTDSTVPVKVRLGSARGKSVTVGGGHACAITTKSRLRCWGLGGSGQLGTNTITDSSVPVPVYALSKAKAVTAGATHTCAITTASKLRCWGANTFGQLGNGTTANSSRPVAVSGLGKVKSVSPGQNHTCALTSKNAARCWGYNLFGQLGNTTTTNTPVPQPVAALGNARALAAGDNHTCAVTSKSRAKCWGYNGFGQLGNGTNTDAAAPVGVTGLS